MKIAPFINSIHEVNTASSLPPGAVIPKEPVCEEKTGSLAIQQALGPVLPLSENLGLLVIPNEHFPLKHKVLCNL
jgi:hypothetical protein